MTSGIAPKARLFLGCLLGLVAAALLSVISSVSAAPVLSPPVYSGISADRSTAELNLKTFMDSVDRIALRLEAREWARSYYDAWLYPDITPQQDAETSLLKDIVLDSMDLSAFPDWRRETAAIETALMLRELLRSKHITKYSKFRELHNGLWTLPGTYLQAASITSGMNAGDVVFTADTVANIPLLYNIQRSALNGSRVDTYQLFTDTPGGLDPPRWAGIAFKLPRFLRASVGSNTIFQWGLATFAIAVFFAIPLAVGKFAKPGSQRIFLWALIASLLARSASSLILDDAGLSGWGATAVTLLFIAIRYIALAIVVLIFSEWMGHWISATQRKKNDNLDVSVVRLAARAISVTASIAIVIYGISTMGVPVFGIIAGFGVGGLAVALATKQTLENILAGVILFLDASVKVGDEITSSNFSGVVEDIGMRSTRIRAPDGGLISVTNSELANTVFKNVSRTVAGHVKSDG